MSASFFDQINLNHNKAMLALEQGISMDWFHQILQFIEKTMNTYTVNGSATGRD